ncbi:MAG: ribonuclease J [Dehalococcoidia bacterium]|nr:ribonuclease J [Dehalococcoidia bacterium]
MPKEKLKLIPLGGLGEIGKNMMAVEYGEDILVVDAGLMFPDEEMLGIDLVIPDISYLVEHSSKVRGIVITHAHEDHIGAIPYVLPQLNVPIYCTKLAKGLISVKLKERKNLAAKTKFNVVDPGGSFTLGRHFNVEFFPVCHSIPDSVGFIIRTPAGTIVHTGDFKLDYTPVSGLPTDLARLAQAGSEGVLLLMADSTYAELPGYTPSERVVGDAIDRIVANASGRVLVTTFASLISRIQQIIDAAHRHGRRVFVIGRSMTENVRMASELGYLKLPAGVMGRMDELARAQHDRVVVLTTGSQGEPTSGLVRIASRANPHLSIVPGDTVIISASPIPGNESLVNRTVDSLFRQGAQVFHGSRTQVHVHGHAAQEELKLILSLTKPKYFVPVHGEYRHLTQHALLAQSVGVPAARTFVLEDGDVLELDASGGKVSGTKVPAGNVYVDGLSVGDVDGVILRNRRMLSRDGIVVVIIAIDKRTGKLVSRPDIVSRGFVDVVESKDILEGGRDLVADVLNHGKSHSSSRGFIDNEVKNALDKYFYDKTKRRPMILPVLVQV